MLSRRNAVDHTNVADDEIGGSDAEPAGVVTTAIAAVTPPPTGAAATAADDDHVKATIPAPTGPVADPARATV